MTTVQYISDLHTEINGPITTVTVQASIVILAGDIGNTECRHLHPFLADLSRQAKKFSEDAVIIYVPGNHEYYTNKAVPADQKLKSLQKLVGLFPNIYLLEQDTKTIGHIEIIGCCLWCSPLETCDVNDYKAVYESPGRMVTTETMRAWNTAARIFIRRAIDTPTSPQVTKRVLVTHFMPFMNQDIPHSRYPLDPLMDALFGNTLYDVLSEVDVAICGHTHQRLDFVWRMGGSEGTRCLCNPYGYQEDHQGHPPTSEFIVL